MLEKGIFRVPTHTKTRTQDGKMNEQYKEMLVVCYGELRACYGVVEDSAQTGEHEDKLMVLLSVN